MKTIFVSSTFRDFQQERDALHDKILPVLNAQSRRYGEEVSFCDLRWGVDTSNEKDEEESSAKVLSVCMNEIDRSRPYMLVLLGERYGFMPGEAAIGHEAVRKDMELEQLEISVTALEVEYGALSDPATLSNTWFYFRELSSEGTLPPEFLPESREHERKLSHLKERIHLLAGDRIRFYKAHWENGHVTGLEDFITQVEADVTDQLRTEWETYERLDPYEKDSLSQWNYMTEKCRSFSVFSDFAAGIIKRLEGSEPVTVVTGCSGSGKSTLFAKVCLDLRTKGTRIFPFVCGNTSLTTDAFGILQSLVWQLEDFLGEAHIEESPSEESFAEGGHTAAGAVPLSMSQWRNRLDELCLKAVSSGQILIAVDALDQLQGGEIRDLLQFLPSVRPQGLHLFLTCLEDYALPGSLTPVSMPRMDEVQRHMVIKGILAAIGKELTAPVTEALIRKNPDSTPLYLYLAVSRLTLMNAADFQNIRNRGDGIEGITARQLELVEDMPEGLEEMCAALVEAVGERINPSMCQRAVSYLALSRLGLRLTDLESLLETEQITFQTLEFAQFVNYMNELFLLRADGRYDFLHKSLRQGLLRHMTATGMNLTEGHEKIVSHLESLPDDDIIQIQEITWESMQADDPCSFYHWLSHIWSCTGDEKAAAARDIAEKCREDEGLWIAGCMEGLWEMDYTERDRNQMLVMGAHFLAVQVCSRFGDSLQENRTKIQIGKAAVSNMERLAQENPSELNLLTLSESCRVLAGYYLKSDQPAERDQAVPLLEQGRRLMSQRLHRNPAPNDYLRLAEVNVILSEIYCLRKDENSLQRAKEYGEAALQCQENAPEDADAAYKLRMRLNSHMAIAQVCTVTRTPDSLHLAYSHTLSCTQELENLLAEDHSQTYLDMLGRIDTCLVGLCQNITDICGENLDEEALTHAIRARDLLEERMRYRNTPETRNGLASAWYVLGNAHRRFKGASHNREAVACLQKSTQFYQALEKELGTPASRYSLAGSYDHLARACWNASSLEDRQTALQYARQGEALAASLAREIPNTLHQELWYSLLAFLGHRSRILGDTLRSPGTQGNASEAGAYYKDALHYSRLLAENAATQENRRELSLSLHRMGRYYRETEGTGNLDKAFSYYEEYARLTRELEEDTLPSRREVRNSFFWMGDLMEAYGDESHLYQAVDLYEQYYQLCRGIASANDAETQDDRELQASLSRLYNACMALIQRLGQEAPADATARSLALYQRGMAPYLEIPAEQRTREQRMLLAAAFHNMGTLYVKMGGSDHLSHALQSMHQAVSVLVQETGAGGAQGTQNNGLEEAGYDLLGKICLQALPLCVLREGESGPERLYFEAVYVHGLEKLCEGWETPERLQELNRWSYDLGARYEEEDTPDPLQVIRCYKLEAWAGERLLALAEAGKGQQDNPPDPGQAADLEGDISSACYRVASRLKKLGSQESIREAILYEKRDIALSRKAWARTPDQDTAASLADSLAQLGLLYGKLEQPHPENTKEAIRCHQEELALRLQIMEATADPDDKESTALCAYRLSGLCRGLGGEIHALEARQYSSLDVRLTGELLAADPSVRRRRDLCSSLIRARLAEEAWPVPNAEGSGMDPREPVTGSRKAALDIQQQVICLRREILAESPSEKHQKELDAALEKWQELMGQS